MFCNFCNLVNILRAGPAAPATTTKVQIRGFLQFRKSTAFSALTALEKLLSPSVSVTAFLSGEWEHCENGLYGNEEYDTCRAESSMWIPIRTTGDFGNSNKGRAANKNPQTAVIASSVDFRCTVVCFPFELTPRAAGQGPHAPQSRFGASARVADRAAYRRGGAARWTRRPTRSGP
jgi:hypothetical protein